MVERGYWDQYAEAYEECLSRTSTEWAPWHIVPADHKWATRTLVATIITEAIHDLDLKRPKVGKELRQQIRKAKAKLERE
jgi:polyphosphate kinase 2 (PPK2 family)